MGPLPKQRLHYEGPDWETHSWPMARAYDLLSRIQDLSLFRDSAEFQHQETEGAAKEAQRLGLDVAAAIADIGEDLRAQIVLAQGDLYPDYNENHFSVRLQFFQILIVLEELEYQARMLAQWYRRGQPLLRKTNADPPSATTPRALFESLHHLADQLKIKLKIVDQ